MKLPAKISLSVSGATLVAGAVSLGVAYVLHRLDSPLVVIITVSLAVAMLLAAGIVWLLTRQIMGPIQELNAAISRVTLGDLSQEVAVRSSDELGLLSSHFSDMTRQLSRSYRNLEASSQEAKARRAELESSIESLKQGFILTDVKLKVLLMNAAALSIVHDNASKPVAKGRESSTIAAIEQALPAEFDLTNKIKETIKSGKLATYPDMPLDGRFLNLYLSPVRSGDDTIGCVVLVEDVTEERIIARSRDEFFSIASHELRTPLAAIRGNASMIQQYFPQVLKDPAMKQMIADIQESSVRLTEIVGDFLDMSRLEQGKMKYELQAFALEPIIEKVVYEMSGLSQTKHVAIKVEQLTPGTLPSVYADPNRVTQVIYNLLGNAMKFTEHGSISVDCQTQDHFVKVSVTDTGIGISPEGQQILFHKFQQSTASILTRDNTRGTGLGLYIAKLMIEQMGGNIKLEHSEAGKGSTFSFTVPVATQDQAVAVKSASDSGEPSAAADTPKHKSKNAA